MQLLLFLSAMLAGLTGAISGDRPGAVRVEQGASIARAAQVAAETTVAVAEVRAILPSVVTIPVALTRFAIHSAPAALPVRLVNGRWLE